MLVLWSGRHCANIDLLLRDVCHFSTCCQALLVCLSAEVQQMMQSALLTAFLKASVKTTHRTFLQYECRSLPTFFDKLSFLW